MRKYLLTATAVAAASFNVAKAANLLVNGSFEDPVVGNGTTMVTIMPGWTTNDGLFNGGLGQFEIWRNAGNLGVPQAPDGQQLIELNANGEDTITSNSFNTVVGGEYEVSFDYATRPGAFSIPQQISVSLSGDAAQTASRAANTTSTAVFSKTVMDFVAQSASSSVQFTA